MSKTNMNPIFSLKNFRSFGEDGADFELAPITVLTGCNSAGKSSLVKAILLQEQVSKAIARNYSTNKIGLHISDKELALGTFKKLLNKKATNGVITISYRVHSYLLAEDVKVTLDYIEDTKNVVGNGVLSKLQIEKVDGTFIYSENLPATFNSHGEKNMEQRNYLSILENFKRYAIFARYEDALSRKQNHDDYVNFYFESPSKEKEQKLQHEIEVSKDVYERMEISKKDEIGYLYTQQTRNVFCNFDLVAKWLELGTIFYYLPVFKETQGKEKNYLRQYLMSEIDKGEWKDMKAKVQDWVTYFANDFEASSCESFLDYFLSMEREALANGLVEQHSDSWSLKTVTTGVIEDFEKNIFRDFTPVEMQAQYRLGRDKYNENWSFFGMVSVLTDICNHTGIYELTSHADKSRWSIMDSLKRYFYAFLLESLSPRFLKEIKYINSSSVQIKRVYSVEDADKFGISLKQYLDGNRQKFDYQIGTVYINKAKEAYRHGEFLNKWIKKLDIGDSIKIKGTDEGLGVLLYLDKDGEERLLADEGYGISQLVALLLQIEVQIANATIIQISGSNSMVYNPIYELSSIFVEEPEVHLHPKYQSLLADMFVEAYLEYNIRFIIETHSEYLIRKLQVMVADKDNALTSDKISINYVEKNEEGVSHNRQIKILEDGRLSSSFGEGFFDHAGNLSRQLLKING